MAIQPERVLILYTTTSEPLLEKVMAFSGLTARQLEKRPVNPQDAVQVYQAIKETYFSQRPAPGAAG